MRNRVRSIILSLPTLLLLSSLAMIIPRNLHAQGGSIYSQWGFGDRLFTHSAAAASTGGCEIALPPSGNIPSLNPALWSTMSRTQIETGYLFRQFINVQSGRTVAHNNGKVEGINLVIATRSPQKWAVNIGLHPYSTVNVYTAVSRPFAEDVVATSTYLGSGGLSQLRLGGSVEIMSEAFLGAAFIYTFGKIQRSVSTNFNRGTYRNSFLHTIDWFQSTGIQIGGYFRGWNLWHFGIMAMLPTAATVDRQQQYGTGRLPDTTFSRRFSTNLPPTIGLGIARRIGHWIIALDGLMEDYTTIRYQNPYPSVTYDRSYRLSLGGRWHRSDQIAAVQNPASWQYSIGVYWYQLPLTVRNTHITEIGLAAGLQLPLNAYTVINIAITAGQRGTTANGLIRDWFGLLHITLSVGERWFQ